MDTDHGAEDPTGRDDALLRRLVEALESRTGEPFFRELVRRLAEALGVDYAFVSELTRGGTHFRTLAVWARGAPGEDFEIPLDGTPCEAVLRGERAFWPDRLRERFARDAGLVAWGAESYAGVPMVDSGGAVLGHFAIMHRQARADGPRALGVMRILAARAVAELERQRALAELRGEKDRLARLIESAADGIVSYAEDGTLVLMNRAAERLLRCRREKAIGTPVWRFGTEDGIAATRLGIERLREDPEAIIFAGEAQGLRARRGDGTTFAQEASLSRSEVNGRALYTVIFRDIDERKQAARELEELSRHNEYLQEEIRSLHNFEEIVGRSAALRRVLEQVEMVAGTEAAVLLRGETGTGKELFARAIHDRSGRRARPLVKVNCAALSPGLVESELFGHERGAFTGATERRMGRFELAHRGTLFLDEVGEIPLETQAKLLRVLQEGEFERVGGSQTIRVDVRVIAATNRDLEAAIAQGAYREDLFYRLNVFPIALPALRERRDDIPLLVHFFVARHAARVGRRIDAVAPEAMQRLVRYAWPGNVRELENVLERAVIVSPGRELEVPAEMLAIASPRALAVAAIDRQPAPAAGDAARGSGDGDAAAAAHDVASADGGALDAVQRRHIIAVLRETGWRIEGASGAARRLGVNPSTLRSRIKKLGIRRSDAPVG